MRVTKITESADREILAALHDLATRYERGEIRGLLYAVKLAGQRQHRIGFCGHYWQDVGDALCCVSRMEYKLNQLMSVRDGEVSTDIMPL